MIGICKNEHGWYLSKHRREARKKYVEKQLDKADLPFWW
jgi:hypothetical protein